MNRPRFPFTIALLVGCPALAQQFPPLPSSPQPAVGVVSTAALGAPRASNLVINGDFEAIVGGGCQYNLTNASLNTVLSNATAFGLAEEIDVMTGGSCYGAPAVSGVTKIALARKQFAPFTADELSLHLSSPVIAGATYSLSLSVLRETSFGGTSGFVDVGVSSAPNITGASVFAASPALSNVWESFSVTFVAPVSGGYLTLSAGLNPGWSHVDNVQLVLVSGPVSSYCTAGTTTNGCVPTLSWTGTFAPFTPSGFVIACNSAEGQRAGLMFYGINGPLSAPWAVGSSSFLCVKAPVQRMSFQNSGGTAGACNGSFVEDFNTWTFTHPSALGSPYLPGTTFNLQTWYRDPPAPGTTNLSDAVQFQ